MVITVDVATIKTEMKKTLSGDPALMRLVSTVETTYTVPASNGGRISILNGEITYESIAVEVPIIVMVRTRVPSRATSDAQNDAIIKRVIELLTSRELKRLNGTASSLKSYSVTPYEEEEDTETRAVAITFVYTVVEAI